MWTPVSCLTGTDVKNAHVHYCAADLSVSPVGRHGDGSSTSFPLCVAADDTCEDAAAASSLHPQRAADCESHFI